MSQTIPVKEAAKVLNVTPHYVRLLVKRGKLKAIRTTPRKTRIYKESLERLIDENNDNN